MPGGDIEIWYNGDSFVGARNLGSATIFPSHSVTAVGLRVRVRVRDSWELRLAAMESYVRANIKRFLVNSLPCVRPIGSHLSSVGSDGRS